MLMCSDAGVKNNEYGVWGGVFLSSGLMDKMKNAHKTKEVWKQIKAKQNV
jgi:glucokinase